MNSNSYNNIYCSCAITVKNYLFALLGSIVLVILSSFIFDFSFLYAFLFIIAIMVMFYIEINYANDYSFVQGCYLNELLQSDDQKLVLTIKSILEIHGYVTIAALEKIKRTIQQDCSIIDDANQTKRKSGDLVENVIVRYLINQLPEAEKSSQEL